LVDGSAGGCAGGASSRHFSAEEMKALFTYRGDDTSCDTADLLRAGKAGAPAALVQRWRDASGEVEDEPLREAVDGGAVTFVYVHPQEDAAAALAEALEQLEADEAQAEEEAEAGEEAGGGKGTARALADWSDDDDDAPQQVTAVQA